MAATYEVGEGYASALNQTAIDLIPGDLAVQGVQSAHVYYYDADDHSVAYAETLDINTGFSNGSATDYIDIQAMVSHGRMRDKGIIIDVSSSSVEDGVYITASYTRIHGFCIKKTTYRASPYWNSEIRTAFGDHIQISDNIIYGCESGAGYAAGIRHETIGGMIFNNQFLQIGAVSGIGRAIVLAASSTVGNELTLANNTIISTSFVGLDAAGKDYINISNNYAADAFYVFADCGAAHNTFNYNISSDASAGTFGGTGNLINKAAVDCFESVVAGKENLDLRYTGACYRKGQDNSSLFTTDCAGNTWSLWETGAVAKQYKRIYNVDGDETDQITSNGVITP